MPFSQKNSVPITKFRIKYATIDTAAIPIATAVLKPPNELCFVTPAFAGLAFARGAGMASSDRRAQPAARQVHLF